MTVTLDHPHTRHHNRATRNIVMALIAVAIVFGIRSITNMYDTATTPPTGQTRPAIVDPTGLGAALSVTYNTSHTRPAIVDPTGLGAALSVTYDTLSLDG